LINKNESFTNTSVPFLSSIPLLGNAFKSRAKVITNSELIIVLIPHIVNVNKKPSLSEFDISISKKSQKMRDFQKAKKLFTDVIDARHYFDSASAEVSRYKIKNAIQERYAPLIFLIGDPGVGKSYILRLISDELEKKGLSIFIDHPFFDKRDLLKILYEAKNIEFDKTVNFNNLKEKLLEEYKDDNHTIFIDEAQLLNEEQFELIRILSDTKIFQFMLSMHKEEGSAILEKNTLNQEQKKL